MVKNVSEMVRQNEIAVDSIDASLLEKGLYGSIIEPAYRKWDFMVFWFVVLYVVMNSPLFGLQACVFNDRFYLSFFVATHCFREVTLTTLQFRIYQRTKVDLMF